MSDKSLADLERSVEEAWHLWDTGGQEEEAREVLHRLAAYMHAIRAARAAGYVSVMVTRKVANAVIVPPPDGYVPVLVSRESVEALRKALAEKHPQLREEEQWKAFLFVVRDLADVLKETTNA